MHQQLFELSTTKYFGFYRGQVINNVDPDQAGKCQIAIGPMFLGIAATSPTNLPWAFPAQPVTFGSGVNFGTMNIPQNNSWVYCFFLEGDVYQPVYCFEAPTLTLGIPPNIKTNYPNTRGFSSPAGLQIDVDDTATTIDINSTTSGAINLTASGVNATGNLVVGAGATGTFVSADGQMITVVSGVITSMI